MANEAIEARVAINAADTGHAIDAIVTSKAKADSEARDGDKTKDVLAIEAIEVNVASSAKDVAEDIKDQLAKLGAYQTEKYLLSADEKEVLLELLNSESLEPNIFVPQADCVPFTLKDLSFGKNNIFYTELIEKVHRRIKLIHQHNDRHARMTLGCLYIKNPIPLTIALIIIKYAHYNLLTHLNAKIALQMRDLNFYPKKFDKRFMRPEDDWNSSDDSYTARNIFRSLILQISFSQFLLHIGPIAQLFHLFYDRITTIKAKIRELPIKKRDKQDLKDHINDGTFSVITTASSHPSSHKVIITHNNLKKHAEALTRIAAEDPQNSYFMSRIAELIGGLDRNEHSLTSIINTIQYRIDKLLYIISQCQPLLNSIKPLSAEFDVPSRKGTQTIINAPINIYSSIIEDANTDIKALRASIHYVVDKPKPVIVEPPVRSATPPPKDSPDPVVVLSSPTKTLPEYSWLSELTRPSSPTPASAQVTTSNNPPSAAAPPVNSLFPPAAIPPPTLTVAQASAQTIVPQANASDNPDSSRRCCFF